MSEEIAARLTPIFHTVFNDETIVITRELTAQDVAQWDSLNHVNLIVSIESEYGIRFTNTEIAELKDVGQLIDLIEMKTSH